MRRRILSATTLHRRLTSSLIAAVLLLSMAPVLGQAPTAQAQTSPAGDHAQVIAQGVAALPATEVSWQALFFSAGPLDATGTINADGQSLQSPSFLLATEGPFLTVDPSGKIQHRLTPGEAAFTPGEARLNPLSESTDLVRYVALTLVATSGPKSSVGIPFYAGEPFTVEPSVRDFALVHGLLDPGQSTELDSGEIPALFLTLEGQLELTTPAGDSAVLETDQAITYGGEITITNVGSSRGTFVSAIAGDEVSISTGGALTAAPRTASSRTTPSPSQRVTMSPSARFGSFMIDVSMCPVPVNPAQPNLEECGAYSPPGGAAAALDLSLSSGSSVLYPDSSQANIATWANLPPGTYTLNQNASSEGFHSVRVGDQTLVCCQAGALSVTIDTSQGDVSRTLFLYFELDGPATGQSATTLDTDGDRLSNEREDQIGSDSQSVDTDGDGLTDYEEVDIYQTNPVVADMDSDGIDDGDEIAQGSNPFDELDPVAPAQAGPDLDGDRLSDERERQIGSDPAVVDSDEDGLTDYEEVDIFQSNPVVADMDGDGIDDGDEVEQGSNPFDATDPLTNPTGQGLASIDTDADGIPDDQELGLGTDPVNSDTDGDGMIDGAELNIGFDPRIPDQSEPAGVEDSELELANEVAPDFDPLTADSDGDGVPDGTEVDLGTDPFTPDQ